MITQPSKIHRSGGITAADNELETTADVTNSDLNSSSNIDQQQQRFQNDSEVYDDTVDFMIQQQQQQQQSTTSVFPITTPWQPIQKAV